MKTILFKLLLVVSYFLIIPSEMFSQIENVPLSNPVYNYLKEMRVKRIIPNLNDDDPNLSRFQIANYLDTIQRKRNELSETEKKLLKKYRIEFVPSEINKNTTMSLLGGNLNTSNGPKYLFSDKQKYLYAYKKNNNNVFINGLGNLFYGNELVPSTKPNAKLFDVGFSIRGSLFDHLGYYFSVLKGGAVGDTMLMEAIFPQIKSNFKYVENIENIKNYDFANGYMKLHAVPTDGMDLFVQLGREQLKYGLGYSSRLALSGDAPNMDFIKFNLDYGIINYSMIFGSTVGEYHRDPLLNYTKYFNANRLKLSFENLFDIGIAETVISSRGFELAYLNPVIFYKFVEHSLQDRDNGTIFFDIQTHFLKDFELQGTFFLDENILSNLSDFEKSSNKSAYQLGFFYYEPVGIKNLALIFEYTKIRPYVYSHFNEKNIYTSFGVILGHPIGPNADQIFTKLTYNFGEKVNFGFEWQKIRKGNNTYDTAGNLVNNVGGSVFNPYIPGVDSSEAIFLDGIRVNTDILSFKVSYEPIKNYVFDLVYDYNISKNLTYGTNSNYSYIYARFNLGFY